MYCKKCKKEISDTPYCQYCGAKQTINRTRRGNGTGSAYKRGAYWTAQVTIGYTSDGKRRYRKKCGFKTKKDALAYIPELQKLDIAKQPSHTLAYYHDSWLSVDAPKLSKSKQGAYKIAWNKLEQIHNYKVSDLNIILLRDLVNDVAPTFYPARDIKSLLSHIFKLAIADQQMTVNMSEYITLPAQKESEQTPWTQDEIKTIWDQYDQGSHMAAYLLLMIYTGMMPGELFKCEKAMIHYDSNEIIGSGLKTEVRKNLSITFPQFLAPVLQNIESFTPDDYPKIVRRNKWDFYSDYHDFTKENKIRDLPMYSCRHTTATALSLGTGANPSVIQQCMRHASFRMTQHYIHVCNEDRLAALNSLDPRSK